MTRPVPGGLSLGHDSGLTVTVARRDYAEDPSIADAVEAAWREVGVTPQLTKRALELVSARPASESMPLSLSRVMSAGPATGRHETGLSVRSNALEAGFHVVMTDLERSDRGAGGAGDAWVRFAGSLYPAATTS